LWVRLVVQAHLEIVRFGAVDRLGCEEVMTHEFDALLGQRSRVEGLDGYEEVLEDQAA
jgi:hypothetical protein